MFGDSFDSDLRKGIELYGEGQWASILKEPQFLFHEARTQVDLKDKWRNLSNYKSYSEHPIRKFVLLDASHRPILTHSGQPHYYNNRWPRDAALKVASKDYFYPVNSGRPFESDSITIYLREVKKPLDSNEDLNGSIVHVYRGTRRLQPPVRIPKFEGYNSIWVPEVEKICEEQLIVPQK